MNDWILDLRQKSLSGELSPVQEQNLENLKARAESLKLKLDKTRKREVETIRNILGSMGLFGLLGIKIAWSERPCPVRRPPVFMPGLPLPLVLVP